MCLLYTSTFLVKSRKDVYFLSVRYHRTLDILVDTVKVTRHDGWNCKSFPLDTS